MDLYKCEDDLTAQIAARLSGLWPLYLLAGGKMMWIGVQKGGETDWTEAPSDANVTPGAYMCCLYVGGHLIRKLVLKDLQVEWWGNESRSLIVCAGH